MILLSQEIKENFLNISNEETVLFFGAGVSFHSGIPLVYGSDDNQGIVNHLLKKLGLPENEIRVILNSSLPFESYIYDLKMGSRITSLLDIFDINFSNHTHKFMAKCAKEGLIKIFATTNFDSLLEKELDYLKVPYKVFQNEKEFLSIDWNDQYIKVIKLHGSIENKDELSITIEKVASKDYLNGFQQTIEYIFHNGKHKNVLVMGYSCSDIFDITPAILKKSNNPPTIFFVQHDTTDLNKYEKISIADKKNPFKYHSGYRYYINTDKLLQDLARTQFDEELKICSNMSDNSWKNIIDRWYVQDVFSSNAIIVKLFYDISEFYLAEKYLDEAIKLSTDFRELLSLFINLIPILVSINKYEKANLLANKIVQMPKDYLGIHTLVIGYINIAMLRFHLDRYSEALELLLKAEEYISKPEIAKHVDQKSLHSRILAMLGECYVRLGDFSKAPTYLFKAETLSNVSGEIYSKSIIYRSMAKIFEKQGNIDQSIEYVKKSIDLSRRLSNKHFEAASWIELGSYYRQIREFEESIDANTKAIEIANELQLDKIIAIARGNIGLVYIETEKYDKAKDALQYAIDNTDGLLGASYKINYGVLCNNNRNYNDAIKVLTDAVEILKNEQDYIYKNELRRTYINLTGSYLRTGDLNQAKQAAKESLNLAIELNNIDGEIRARVNLGIALSELCCTNEGQKEVQTAHDLSCKFYGKNHPESQNIANLLSSYELPVEYAYYIEPCQLCLERGDFNNCGWCTDYDSSAGNGKVKLPKGGWGYPYHHRAHSERKYYTVDDVHITELDGKNVD